MSALGRRADVTRAAACASRSAASRRPRTRSAPSSAGADALGFVFWPTSPRARRPGARPRRIARALPAVRAVRVGVFVDAPRDEMSADRRRGGPRPAAAPRRRSRSRLRRRCRGRRSRRCASASGFTPRRPRARPAATAGAAAWIAPAGRDALPAGRARSFDWSLAAACAERVPFLMLAGGLSPENVAAGRARRPAARGRRLERRRAHAGRQGPRARAGLRRGGAGGRGRAGPDERSRRRRAADLWPDAAGHFGPTAGGTCPRR